jgi:alpha-1,3-rhamnosyl/mannosyltransferase
MSARRAKRIIAISEFSKSEVMKYTGQLASKIDVTPLAGDASCGEHLGEERKGAVLRKYGIAGAPYIFCVANTYPHKQVHMLVEAYGRIMDRIPHRLVILGRARLGEGLVENAMAKVSDRDRVSRLDYIDREDLPALYQAASLFVFPSVYEGFGLPVLEAMMAGVRVLTNRSASIPEVGGDTVAYSRPDAESMAASILEALGEDQARRRTRLQQAAERAASLFSWTKCARATLKSFSDALADD